MATRPTGPAISSLSIAPVLKTALISLFGADLTLSPPQLKAIEQGILEIQQHYLVAAPTNSGKTLVALLRIFHRALAYGGRFVYVAPLKALAEEKATELRALAGLIAEAGGRQIAVEVSTGDYRISEDFPDSPPPENAEILVCTPERLEVILRNPLFRGWAKSVDTYVLDEFHMLGQGERGARFEALVTRLLLSCQTSVLLALSATFGSVESVAAWLGSEKSPAVVIKSEYRHPELKRRLIFVQDKDAFIADLVNEIEHDDDRSLLVFVYRKLDAEKLAKSLDQSIVGSGRAVAFHSGLGIGLKKKIASEFRDRKIKVLVCTTTLAMGVNTPATDVVVRDTLFHGFGRLTVSDIQQMTGRAGRGDVNGIATVLFQENDDWSKYADDLRSGKVDDLRPQLIRVRAYPIRKGKTEKNDQTQSLGTALLAEISSQSQVVLDDIQAFVLRTYSSHCASVSERLIRSTIEILEADKLIYRLENSEATYAATRLGRTTSYSGLTAGSGAIIGSFLRALITLSEKNRLQNTSEESLLRRITDLDLLVLCLASHEARDMLLPKGNKELRSSVEEFIERLPPDEKPVLNLWRNPDSPNYPTRRLIATLKLSGAVASDDETTFWRLMRTGAMLLEHARGCRIEALADRYGIREGDLEGRLKPSVGWLLNSLASICTGERCYRLDFLAIRAYELMQSLTVGGPLGKLINVDGIGIRTIESLTAFGVRELSELASKSPEQLAEMGVRTGQREAIRRFMLRSSR